MSRYQPAPYSDAPAGGQNYGGSYGNGGSSGNNYGGGYQDEDNGYGSNVYGKGAGTAAGAGSYPMSSGNPYASGSSPAGYRQQPKNNKKKWWIIGGVIAAIVILGAVLGGVLGTRNKGSSSDSSSGNETSGSANTGVPSGVSDVNTGAATATGANGQAYLAIQTDSYMLPIYGTGTNTAGYSAPTTVSNPSSNGTWPADPSPPSNDSIRAHPRIIAPQYKWDALTSGLIANDPYLKYWNDTLVQNASATIGLDPVPYTLDGGLDGSGVLDVARKMKLRVKKWAYAFRITGETRYADRVYRELQAAAGNLTEVPFGDEATRWNAQGHFLDTAEFINVFAIGYDWLYDHWTEDQRNAIMWSMINLGLNYGLQALTGDTSQQVQQWWTSGINGNWNCVCNGGLTLGALAIVDRDPTEVASKILALSAVNAGANCFQGPHSDGTWSETANYWYFGTSAAGEMVSALTTAYGDDRGLTAANPGWEFTSLYHIYAQGMTSLFNYGDHGPNKFATTANSLMLWGSIFNTPRYTLYQRDHSDATEDPWSMFWYDPSVSGTWWDGLALDMHFPDSKGEWATGRSTWSDNSGSYWAMKSGNLTAHQTHGDLDLGDFVYDAAGQRWFGELGSGQYLSDGYFSSEAQNSERYLYYRKRTEGQNTILIDYQNQNVNALPPTGNFGSLNTTQGAAPSFTVQADDTAYFVTDLSSAYNYTVKRGIRYLNARRQLLIQDDISGVPTGTDVQWRAHTNATVAIASNGTSATLTLGGETLVASIVTGPSGAAFSTAQPTPVSQDPPVPSGSSEDGNQSNDGVTVLVVDNPNGGSYSLEILFRPQWSDVSSADYAEVKTVALDSWSVTSHN